MPASVDVRATRAATARPRQSERSAAARSCLCPSRWKRQLRPYAMRRNLAQGKLGIAAERQLQALAQRGEPGAKSTTHRLHSHARVGDAQRAAARLQPRLDFDIPTQFAGIDSVTHGVL